MKRFKTLAGLLLFLLAVFIPSYKAAAHGTGSFLAINWLRSQCSGMGGYGWVYTSGYDAVLKGNPGSSQIPNYWSDCKDYSGVYYVGGTMIFDSNAYPPESGRYGLALYLCTDVHNICGPSVAYWHAPVTQYAYLSASLTLAEQNIPVNTGTIPPPPYLKYTGETYLCYALISDSGKAYGNLPNSASCYGGGVTPVPPTPPTTSTCSINNGNDINVDLGTLDRAQMPTTPGGGTPKTVPISVVCSGDVAASVNMKLNYTPVTMGSTQAIPTSTTGVGVAVSYNDAVLTPSDSKPISFIIGSNTVNLDFAAIRDPAVAVKDIAAGAFTASAVLVMTQQ